MSRHPSQSSRLKDFLVRLGLAAGLGTLAARLIARRLTSSTRFHVQQSPSALGLDWQHLSCLTDDGHRLYGWSVEPASPSATLLLFHGLRNNREQMLSRMAFLVPSGYRCVAFDHRAHGESEGRISSFGYHERRDVRAVLDLVGKTWPDQPAAVLGISMGAAAVCFAAEQVAPRVSAVILESLYHDILSAFSQRLQSGHYPPFFRQLTRRVIRQCERRVGLTAHDLTPANWIGALAPAPVLLLTGMMDGHSTPQEAEMLFARRKGPAELFLVPHAGHEDVCETGGLLYQQRILAFLARSLFQSQGEAA